MEKMLKFINLDQNTPEKRSEDTRTKDFNEIYKDFIANKAQEQ